jgi:hypothetical protein
MVYDGALVLPRGAVALSKEEMMYVEGGLKLPINRGMLSKTHCTSLANSYKGSYGSMSPSAVAKEIYAHAFLYYYGSPYVAAIGIVMSLYSNGDSLLAIASDIRRKASWVDIGYDSALRKAVYNIIWSVF